MLPLEEEKPSQEGETSAKLSDAEAEELGEDLRQAVLELP